MYSLMSPELRTLEMLSRINSGIHSTKSHINELESCRIETLLKTLKLDEERLTNCIDDVEKFHRDMFVLITKNKAADSENRTSMNGDTDEGKYSVIEPENSENNQDILMHQESSPTYEPHSSMDVQPSAGEGLFVNNPRPFMDSMMEPVHNYVSSDSDRYVDIVVSGYNVQESSDGIDGSGDGVDESSDGIDRSGDGIDESSDGVDGSGDGMNKSSQQKNESTENNESSDDESEMAKRFLLNLLADREKEITESVLNLIHKFSCFQRKLRAAEKSVPQTKKFFPGRSSLIINRMLKDLTGCVLYLDRNVSIIYSKYFEMLESSGQKLL